MKIEKMDFLGYIYPIQELDTRKELLFSVVFLRLFIPEDIAVYAYKCHLSSSFNLSKFGVEGGNLEEFRNLRSNKNTVSYFRIADARKLLKVVELVSISVFLNIKKKLTPALSTSYDSKQFFHCLLKVG
jgi:hypothetical protein